MDFTWSVAHDEDTVAELFAEVGGFRLGLEGDDFGFSSAISGNLERPSNGKIYENGFGSEGHSNDDIHDIAFNEELAETIRERILSMTFSSEDSVKTTR